MPLLAALHLSFLAATAPGATWLPEGVLPAPKDGSLVCPGQYLSPEQGAAVLEQAGRRFPDIASWDAYARHARLRIQEGAGLSPWPLRTALNPVVRKPRRYDGYSVENVAFESIPGYFVTGNLYRPLDARPSHPVVLTTHGHGKPITTPDDYDTHARFSPGVQTRSSTLARMGAVVLAIDMFAYGDSIQLVGQGAHKQPFALTLQLWNAMRAVDFLMGLEDADRQRVAVTGESGGATQALLLSALDLRVKVSVPVVMVSSHFFGGCPCESGRPVHRSADHFVSNAMIAALTAPRPQLVVSDGKDWTSRVPNVELPFLRRIYGYYGTPANVANVHLADEGHDYGPSKRAAMYRFLAEQLGLNLSVIARPDGTLDEGRVTIERAPALHVFDAEFPIPPNALHDAARIEQALRALQSEGTTPAP